MVVSVRPDSQLAQDAGVALGIRDAIAVDRQMRTNLPDVFAAGDCVEAWHGMLGAPTYMPLGTTAHKQDKIAGENAVGGDREFQGSLGTQVAKVFDLAMGGRPAGSGGLSRRHGPAHHGVRVLGSQGLLPGRHPDDDPHHRGPSRRKAPRCSDRW